MSWTDVERAIPETKAIAFDGCHKIYLLLDEKQVEKMATIGYGKDNDGSELLRVHELPENLNGFISRSSVLPFIKRWFDDSCGLEFVDSVRTVDGDPNDGFRALIEQFEFEEEEAECEGHSDGPVMGETFYCDGSCI